MKIDGNHWIDTAEKQFLPGGNIMETRRLLVIHFTSGASGQSSIDDWKRKANGVCAHFVIERSGKLIQIRGTNRTCGHVGDAGKSRWRDPVSRKMYNGCNGMSIGIELANAGCDAGALGWARRQPGFRSAMKKHRNGGGTREWEEFYITQLQRCFELSKLLRDRYNLDDVTGHDCLSPERRDDPGPCFPMEELREFCGFTGLPVVHSL